MAMKAAAGGETGALVKDDDAVKLFVGQVPKDMGDEDLRGYFAPFGEIFDISIIRDKITGAHRGCAFLTFTTKSAADAAIEALHNKCKLPNAQNPLQVRPADVHSDRESKLFVGMLPKTVDDVLLESIFSPFGKIKEIHIIRTPEGEAKGCAFLKFMEKTSALRAIEELHEKHVVDGASRPLVVKFADTKRQAAGPGAVGMGGRPGAKGEGGEYGAGGSYWVMPHGQPHGHQAYPYQNAAPGMGLGPYMAPPYGNVGMGPGGAPYNQQLYHYPAYYAQPGGAYQSPGSGQPTGPYHFSGVAGGGGGGGVVHGGRTTSPDAAHAVGGPTHSPGGPQPFGGRHNSNKPLEGPPGANLFIYHLPHDLTDADLATAFNPFGTVISAKVYVDKVTGESKGFGFVSYDSAAAAETAIKAMNGFQIGSKRLKVQHKRISPHQQQQQAYPMPYQQQGPPPHPHAGHYAGFEQAFHAQQQQAAGVPPGPGQGPGSPPRVVKPGPGEAGQSPQHSHPHPHGEGGEAAAATDSPARHMGAHGAEGDPISLERSMNRLSLA